MTTSLGMTMFEDAVDWVPMTIKYMLNLTYELNEFGASHFAIDGVKPLVAIVHYLLSFPLFANRSNSPINEAETVVKGCSFSRNCISIHLQGRRVQNIVVPVNYLVAMSLIYVVEDCVGDHAYDRDWSSKAMNKIRISARVGKSFQ